MAVDAVNEWIKVGGSIGGKRTFLQPLHSNEIEPDPALRGQLRIPLSVLRVV